VVGNADGGCTRSEDPALSCLLRRDPSSLKLRRDTRAAVTPVPLAVWLSPPQRFALVVPRVAHGTPMNVGVPRQRPQWCRCRDLSLLVSPAIPADTLSAGRPHKTAHAPRQRLAQAGAGSAAKRLPRCRASLDFFESLTGSPQALSAAITALRAIRRHAVGVTRHNVAKGHFLLPCTGSLALNPAR